jgi:hypothetical protein
MWEGIKKFYFFARLGANPLRVLFDVDKPSRLFFGPENSHFGDTQGGTMLRFRNVKRSVKKEN